jgi:hypothetical protein
MDGRRAARSLDDLLPRHVTWLRHSLLFFQAKIFIQERRGDTTTLPEGAIGVLLIKRACLLVATSGGRNLLTCSHIL